jgi:Mg2+ and Co2+ transporter CorA
VGARKGKPAPPSPPQLSRDELVELVGELAAALNATVNELDTLRHEPHPMDGEVLKGLREREALAATMKRLPQRLLPRAREVYAEELRRAHVENDEFEVTVQQEPLDAAAEALERLRVAGLLDRDVWELHRYDSQVAFAAGEHA